MILESMIVKEFWKSV